MRILVTGSSGFIGFHLVKYLLKKNTVLGIDNNNKYYSEKLKKRRLKLLKKNKNFTFKKINILNKKKIKRYFFKI